MKHILIIDDEKEQAEGMAKLLSKQMAQYGFTFEPLFEEHAIQNAIRDRFFTLAILDIRMNDFPFNGINLYHQIVESNPLAKVIFVSAFTQEFFQELQDILLSGNVLAIMEKETPDIWIPKIESKIREFFEKQGNELSEASKALMAAYSDAKNENNSYQKGVRFENFLIHLFTHIGFEFIQKRCIDMTSETDLIIRNNIADDFLSKFGKYIFVEAKNKPDSSISKNDFLAFKSKMDSSNQLCEFGIIAASGNIAKTVRLEALRTSNNAGKVLLLTNNELVRLIEAPDKRYEFKRLIDEQVKDVPMC